MSSTRWIRISRLQHVSTSTRTERHAANTEKVEPGAMDNLGLGRQSVRPKKDRGAKDPLERCDQSPVLFSALTHSERLQHFGSGSETNCLTFLLHRQRCQKDWNDPVLAEGDAIRVAGDLKDEIAVP